MEEAVREDATAQRERLMEGLRIHGSHYAELSRRFAAWLGLHSTDATAVLEIAAAEERGTLLSPARLSERISLSTGATTALLNRLEAAGHISRIREHSDRRVISLRSGAHIQERADEFFGPLAHRLDAAMSHYPPDLLARFESFMDDMNSTMDAHLAEPIAAPPRSPDDVAQPRPAPSVLSRPRPPAPRRAAVGATRPRRREDRPSPRGW